MLMRSNKSGTKWKHRTQDNVWNHKHTKDILTCYEKCLNCIEDLQLETDESYYLMCNV
jgi:hypothetical protein